MKICREFALACVGYTFWVPSGYVEDLWAPADPDAFKWYSLLGKGVT